MLRVLDMKYNIFFYLSSNFRTFLFTDPDFFGSDPDFCPIRIRTQKKRLIWIREKNPDPKHCIKGAVSRDF